MKQKTLYSCLFFFGCLVVNAQTKNFFFKTLTTRDGLSYNFVNCLLQDREGYIWIGTSNGLNRYDGSDFVVFKYDRNNPYSIAHNNVVSICEGKQGDIWAATANGISRYNKRKNSFINYILKSPVKNTPVVNDATNILCDRHGTIWVGTWTGGLFMFDSLTNTFTSYQHDPLNIQTISSDNIDRNSVVEDPEQDLLWIGTQRGINCFDMQRKVFYNHKNNPWQLPVLEDHNIYALAFDRNYRLVYGDYTDKKIIYYSVEEKIKTTANEMTGQNIQNMPASLACIFFDSKNNGWFSSWAYMIHYNDHILQRWHLVKHDQTNPSSINSDFFWDALEAKDGTIFIGSNNGLSLYHPNNMIENICKLRLVFPSIKDNLDFYSIIEDNTGKIWFGAGSLGIFSYDFTNEHYENYLIADKEDLFANKIVYMSHINDQIWVSTKDGLYSFDHLKKKFLKFNVDTFSHLRPGITYQDSKKNIWISVAAKWLYKFNPETKLFKRYNPDSQFVDRSFYTHVMSASEDKQGNLWFGTYSGQIYQYDYDRDQFIAYAPDVNQIPKIIRGPVNDVHADDNGKVWMATGGGGLIRFDTHTKKFKAWMENDGLIMNECFRLIPDKSGRLWVSSVEGFTIFNTRDEKIVISKVNDGLQENDFFSLAKCSLKNGKIVTVNGGNLLMIDPMKISDKQNKPLPVITGITVFNKPVPLYQSIPSIALSYKENFFTFNFSAQSSFNKGEIEYAYQLTGYDKDWNYSASKNFAAYTGVPGGQYQFEVKAKYKAGVWSNVVSLPVHIHPPFWETWWFRSLVIVSAITLIVFIIKLRERNLLREKKLQSEFRERITATEMQALRSQMNPHFLYNSLNAIRLFVLQNDSENAEKYLVKFTRLMRLILDNSRDEWIQLGSELEQLKLYMELEQLRFDNKFEFSISVDASLQPARVNIPPMILQPYIENAILHGMAHKQTKGFIQLYVIANDHQLECIIEDDGVGREKASQLKNKFSSHKSVGLQVTEERLQLLSLRTGKQTNVQVIDLYNDEKVASGTKVIIHLPLILQ